MGNVLHSEGGIGIGRSPLKKNHFLGCSQFNAQISNQVKYQCFQWKPRTNRKKRIFI